MSSAMRKPSRLVWWNGCFRSSRPAYATECTTKSSLPHRSPISVYTLSMSASFATSQPRIRSDPRLVASGRTRFSKTSLRYVKASSAPSARRRCAMPHAMLRSFARPKMMPFLPSIMPMEDRSCRPCGDATQYTHKPGPGVAGELPAPVEWPP